MVNKNRVVAVVGAGVLALASLLLPSKQAVTDIQREEGTVPVAYQDTATVWTICTGSTRGVVPGMVATPADCEARLSADLKQAGAEVTRQITHPLTQEQYDALVSFTFNVGEGNLQKSTLRRMVNAGRCEDAVREFSRWVYAGGVKLKGLAARRAREAEKFATGCPAWQ